MESTNALGTRVVAGLCEAFATVVAFIESDRTPKTRLPVFARLARSLPVDITSNLPADRLLDLAWRYVGLGNTHLCAHHPLHPECGAKSSALRLSPLSA